MRLSSGAGRPAVVEHELIRVMSVYGKRRLGKAEIIFKGPYEP